MKFKRIKINKADVIIVSIYLLIAYLIVNAIFLNSQITLYVDTNFPLNKDAAIRWITNNIDSLFYDVRGESRTVTGLIFYIIYSLFPSIIGYKLFYFIIFFFGIYFTYKLLFNIATIIKGKTNITAKNKAFLAFISLFYIFNNYSIFSLFGSLSGITLFYFTFSTSLYLIFKFLLTKKMRFLILYGFIQIFASYITPVYLIFHLIFDLIFIIYLNLIIYPNNSYIVFMKSIKFFLIFLFINIVLYSNMLISLFTTSYLKNISPLIDTGLEVLKINTPTFIELFTGDYFPPYYWKYQIEKHYYYINLSAEYYSHLFIKIIYLIFNLLIILSIIYIKEKRVILLYLILFLLMSNFVSYYILLLFKSFKLVEFIAAINRSPYYRVSFPFNFTILLVLSEIHLFRRKNLIFNILKLVLIITFSILLLINSYIILSGLPFSNTPLIYYRYNNFQKLLDDILIINKLIINDYTTSGYGRVIYFPYSNNSYLSCFLLDNHEIYWDMNPFYLLTNLPVVYNDPYFNNLILTNLTYTLFYKFDIKYIIIEKTSCLWNTTISKVLGDNRIIYDLSDSHIVLLANTTYFLLYKINYSSNNFITSYHNYYFFYVVNIRNGTIIPIPFSTMYLIISNNLTIIPYENYYGSVYIDYRTLNHAQLYVINSSRILWLLSIILIYLFYSYKFNF